METRNDLETPLSKMDLNIIESMEPHGDETLEEEEESKGDKYVLSQLSAEEREIVIARNKSKLEKLLTQSDVFDCLRRINAGKVKTYEELDQILSSAQNGLSNQSEFQSRRRQGNADEADEAAGAGLAEILKIEKQPDTLVGGELRDYQLEGLNWLYKLHQSNINGILADEMGLGKTIQSIAIIALIESLKQPDDILKRKSHHIIIVPKITLGKWNKEIQEWLPSLRLFYFYGTNEERDLQREKMREHQFDLVLTTFETVIKEKNELKRLDFEFLILDEAQRIKNDQSVLSQVLRKFRAKHRLLLTGTPLQNNLKELWALLNFLMPILFNSADEFKQLFEVKGDKDDQEFEAQQEYIIKQIHRLLRPFMLRRLKNDVEKNLPPKKEIYLFIGLSKLQKQLYKNILTGNIDVVNGMGDKIKLLNVLMQLKKVCNHPYLFDKVEPGPPFIDGDHLVENAMKFKILDLLLPKLFKEGHKVLIFSQMTRLLDILDDFLRYRGYKYCRIDGQTSAFDREVRIEEFQKENSEKQVFILSTRAGGLGINLHAANVVIIYDSDWNPQVDLQAIDRAHRIGQKKEVVVYRFVTDKSVEEKIVERAARKLKVDHLIMQKGKFNFNNQQSDNQNKMTAQEMIKMLQYGAQEIILPDNEDGQVTEANIDDILMHSIRRTEAINQELSKIEDKFNLNKVSLTGDNEKQTDLYVFEGENYKKKANGQASLIPEGFIDIGQRERKQNVSYDVDKYYREALNITTVTKEKKQKLKGWRSHANGGYDHQFFDNQKLDLLEEKETNWNLYTANPDEYLKNSNQMKPLQYSKKDQQLKENLLKQGFSNWSKKDFFFYIRMCEAYGRDNLQRISEQFPNKTFQEVKDYSKYFWKNWEKIENCQKYIERIEKGEQEIQRMKQIDIAIEEKFKYTIKFFRFQNPDKQDSDFTLDDIYLKKSEKKLANQITNSYEITEEEDKFLAYCLFKYGYGYWEFIKNEIRNSPRFIFNWAIKCRSAQDIQKRCDYLVSNFKRDVLAMKKIEEEEKAELLARSQKQNKKKQVPPSKKLKSKNGRKKSQEDSISEYSKSNDKSGEGHSQQSEQSSKKRPPQNGNLKKREEKMKDKQIPIVNQKVVDVEDSENVRRSSRRIKK